MKRGISCGGSKLPVLLRAVPFAPQLATPNHSASLDTVNFHLYKAVTPCIQNLLGRESGTSPQGEH